MSGLVAAACLALLFTAARLAPSEDGHGTHTQLGMDECAWAESFGAPCATCGMTTAFAHASDGNLVASLGAQPFGALLAVFSASVFWGALHVSVTGSALGRYAARMITPGFVWPTAALFLAAWAYKFVTW